MSLKGINGDDPLGLIITIVMVIIGVFWFSQTSPAVNFIGGNTTIAANYGTAYTKVGAPILWFILSPMALVFFIFHMINQANRDDGSGTVMETSSPRVRARNPIAEMDEGTMDEDEMG